MRARAVVELAIVATVFVAMLAGTGAAVTADRAQYEDHTPASEESDWLGQDRLDHEPDQVHARGPDQVSPVDRVTLQNDSEVPYDQIIDVQLRTNGDARWTVTIYEPLDTESDVEAFRDLGQRWEAGIADVEFDLDLFRQFVDLSSDATGRTMTVPEGSVRRTAEVRDGVGVLELTFTWTNFARQDGDELVVDDAFRSPSGTWLPRLEAGQALVIRPPQDFVIVDSPPGPGIDNQTVRWEGPRTFSDEYFQENPIVYRSDRTPTATPTPQPTPTPTQTTPPSGGSDLPRGLLFGIVAAVLVGGAMAVYRSTSGDVDVATGTDDGDDVGDDAIEAADEGEATADETEPDDPFAGVDEELLSDDERVLRLLEANGGRMKQADIVKETDWSNAKVSQLLSSMAENGEVDKLRIGRENLISLPDVDVENVED